MARIVLSTKSYVIRLMRRQYRKVGLTVRVKDERVYLLKKAEYTYSRSLKQDECRERFRRAQEFASAEMKDPERERYWKRYAQRHHKQKTARGYCLSYWYDKVRSMDQSAYNERDKVLSKTWRETLKRGESAEKEEYELRKLYLSPSTYGTEPAEVLKARRKASGDDDYEMLMKRREWIADKTANTLYLVKKVDLHTVDLGEIKASDYVMFRNGSRMMDVDKTDFVYYSKKGVIDKYMIKRRKEHASDSAMYFKNLFQMPATPTPDYKDKIYFTSDVFPRFSSKNRIEVTIEELQQHDYKKELKTNDVFVTLAGRKVFLDENLIDKMRDLNFLRSIRGISKSDMERIRKANYKLRKSLAEAKVDEPPTVLRE